MNIKMVIFILMILNTVFKITKQKPNKKSLLISYFELEIHIFIYIKAGSFQILQIFSHILFKA